MKKKKKKMKKLRVLRGGMGNMQVERTPEQTDYTNKHEPEVGRNDGEVDGLSGYVHSPEIASEKKLSGGYIWSQLTNYAIASERMPVAWKERYGWPVKRKDPVDLHDRFCRLPQATLSPPTRSCSRKRTRRLPD